MEEKFKIINASAGSGKTFSLASNVIFKMITGEEDTYKKILALTFTNNSANEMKRRILDELKQISIDPKKSKIFKASNLSTLFSHTQIKSKAKRILNKILHNFSFFQIGTIDKFNHRLIRSFSNDLTLSHDFELVIEKDEFSDQLIEKYFDDLKKESFLSDIIINHSSNKHSENKSWDISYDIKNLLGVIWDENNYKYVSNQDMDNDSFNSLENNLSSSIKKGTEKIKKIGAQIEEIIIDIDKSFFSYSALPKLLDEIKSIEIKKTNPNPVLKRLENNSLLKKDKSDSSSIKAMTDVKPLLNEMISLIHVNKTLINLKDNIPLNYLIYNIVNYSKKFQKENNLLLISEFNSLITENISDQPAPFIYEKIGTKYNNYFIDEFQDTSELQWKNLIPLTSHALLNEELDSDGGNLFLVGDPKQSIYRFRGAKPETFTELNTRNPFYLNPEISKLGKNYRSYSNIVDFNNKFFKNNAKILNSPRINSIYSNLNQDFLKEKKGGYLSFNFLKNSGVDYDDKSFEKVLEIINKKEKQGFDLSDIAILCRTNKECNTVSKLLIEKNIKVNSEELLALSSSKEVLLIINIIKLKYDENDLEAKKDILKFISLTKNKNNKYEFIQKHMIQPTDKMFKEVLNIDFEVFSNLELYQASEYVVSSIDFIDKATMQVYFLLDEIYNFSYQKHSFLQSFIDYWEIKKEKLKVNLIEDTNAVKVITIHKSKGLEFPIVILPYFDFKLKKPDKKIWLNFSGEKINGNFLVDYNDSLKFYGSDITNRMNLYDEQMHIDNLNVMYVSLSRAILENHIISMQLDSSQQISSGILLRSYFSEIESSEKNFYQIGVSEYKSEFSASGFKKLRSIKPKNNKGQYNSINNYYKSDKRLSSNFGNIFHNIMSEIEYEHQSDYAISDYYNRGIITDDQKKEIKKNIDQIINYKSLKPLFSKKNTVYNEREIFIPPDKVIKPDKAVFTDQNEVFILDYKTGKKKKTHQNQIRTYASVLKKANYRVKGVYLVYISESIEVLEIDQ